jgi:glycosyltransferase involved in cell wall biosynthesis
MKVIHLANTYNPSRGGGVYEVVHNLRKKQSQFGIGVKIIAPVVDEAGFGERGNVYYLKKRSIMCLLRMRQFIDDIREILLEGDVLHQHGLWTFNSLISVWFGTKCGLPKVVQPHGYISKYRMRHSRLKKHASLLLYEKRNIISANALVACSGEEGEYLKQMFPKIPVAVIENGVADDIISAPFNAGEYDEKSLKLLFLSQIIPVKGLERMFSVIRDIKKTIDKKFVLRICGYGEQKYLKHLYKIVSEYGIGELIEFVGSKYDEEKIKMYDWCDVFVLPSYDENYGIVIAEALSRQKPVLTTKGTPWDLVNEIGCGYCVDNNQDAIKEGLLKIMNKNYLELREMGLKGRQLVLEKYTWNRAAEKTIELYKWVLGDAERPKFVQ